MEQNGAARIREQYLRLSVQRIPEIASHTGKTCAEVAAEVLRYFESVQHLLSPEVRVNVQEDLRTAARESLRLSVPFQSFESATLPATLPANE